MRSKYKGFSTVNDFQIKKLAKKEYFDSLIGVEDGVRTHDPQNHNLML